MSISNIKNFWLSTSVIVSLALIVNLFFLKSRLLGTVLILIYVLLLSFRLGRAIYPKSLWENFFGLITLLSIISILGAAFIYLSSFNALSLAVVLLLIPFGTSLLPSAKKTGNWFERFQNYFNRFIDREETKGASFLILSWAALACFIIILIFHGATEASIQSPWQTIHWLFWPAYFFATLCLIFYFLLAKRQRLPLILVFGHFLLSTIVAIIVYQIGYGYDPFIHQAAEKIIASSGTIEPKTPYYLGLYALVIFFSRLTLLDPVWIDRLLMPVLFSSLLPLTIYFAFNRFCHKKYALIASLSVLTLPYGYAIMTAPQNLANLWFLLAIFLTLSVKEKIFPTWFPFLLALSAITIHPLAGLPFFLSSA